MHIYSIIIIIQAVVMFYVSDLYLNMSYFARDLEFDLVYHSQCLKRVLFCFVHKHNNS